ncbi:DUF4128 domain-containing protein [Aliihoeflea sp. 2WW]|uniref:DUF4128 domain-containing protein n=1 Tax=Aliihoeflea sp. 2WW TaxID=1381123 RepID=UPI000464B932|nr:DUF4128 domain-containing protein [Aliihoeflea sp. 2WW]
MPSIEESIETALFTRANGLAALTGLAISWPNVSFTAPLSGRYLRVSHLPNQTQRLFINSAAHRRPGILQISVVVPLNVGASAATRMAGQVAEHFPMDLRMTPGGVSVRVTKAPDIAPALKEDAAWIVPVSVSYEALT